MRAAMGWSFHLGQGFEATVGIGVNSEGESGVAMKVGVPVSAAVLDEDNRPRTTPGRAKTRPLHTMDSSL